MRQLVVLPRGETISDELFKISWLDDDRIDIAIIQTPKITFSAALNDEPRKDVVQCLKSLLETNNNTPRLIQELGGSRPVIALMPELALSSHDWPEIDRLVNHYPKPLILITGFGFTRGKWLNQWTSTNVSADGTRKSWSWTPILSEERLFNCGSCWIHHPEHGTHCILFQKTFLEQKYERTIEDLATGNEVVRINLGNLILFPLICSDMVNSDGDSPYHLVTQECHSKTQYDRIIIAGMLWQAEKAYTDHWQRAIVDFARLPDAAVIIANQHSSKHLHNHEDFDKWRALSGVHRSIVNFERHEDPSLPDQADRILRPEGGAVGVLLRRTEPSVAFGTLYYSRIQGTKVSKPWTAGSPGCCLAIDSDGRLTAFPKISVDAYELERIIRRKRPDYANLSGIEAYPPEWLVAPLNELGTHILSMQVPTAEYIWKSILFGADCISVAQRLRHSHIDTLDNEEQDSVANGLAVIAALQLDSNISLTRDEHYVGPLIHVDNGMSVNILVMYSNISALDIQRQLNDWWPNGGDHPPLLVLDHLKRGVLDGWLEDIDVTMPRRLLDDEGLSNVGEDSLIRADKPRTMPVYCSNLNDLENALGDQDRKNSLNKIKALTNSYIDTIGRRYGLPSS